MTVRGKSSQDSLALSFNHLPVCISSTAFALTNRHRAEFSVPMNQSETTKMPDLEQISSWLAPMWSGLEALVLASALDHALQGKPVEEKLQPLVDGLLPQLMADWAPHTTKSSPVSGAAS